ncbi:hypothetical protein B0H19DRAFT_160827 [Mycena capillaripes]|nr:hypothetical protein B0H19DRAFT_478637 [Mycena capillaripes]KAJ6553371.1 hypothetical protein B0H19DRAFT_160827 [Mycena capillaripes]
MRRYIIEPNTASDHSARLPNPHYRKIVLIDIVPAKLRERRHPPEKTHRNRSRRTVKFPQNCGDDVIPKKAHYNRSESRTIVPAKLRERRHPRESLPQNRSRKRSGEPATPPATHGASTRPTHATRLFAHVWRRSPSVPNTQRRHITQVQRRPRPARPPALRSLSPAPTPCYAARPTLRRPTYATLSRLTRASPTPLTTCTQPYAPLPPNVSRPTLRSRPLCAPTSLISPLTRRRPAPALCRLTDTDHPTPALCPRPRVLHAPACSTALSRSVRPPRCLPRVRRRPPALLSPYLASARMPSPPRARPHRRRALPRCRPPIWPIREPGPSFSDKIVRPEPHPDILPISGPFCGKRGKSVIFAR